MNQKSVIGYGSQFAILLGLLGAGLMLSGLLMGLVTAQLLHLPISKAGDALLKPENLQLSRLLNVLASFIIFFIPAWAVAKISYKKSFQTMGFNANSSRKQWFLVVFISVGGLFLSGALGALNEIIPMPAAFLRKAREIEAQYKQAMLSMATMRNGVDYLLSLLVIAIAPAVFEEVLFRGGVQRIMVGWTKSAFWGILISSIIFSAIHGSYFGFLPRVGLGIVLGLLYYQSKNIWLNIAMHFINNGIVVTQLYILNRMKKPIEKAMDETMPIWIGLIAIAFLVVAFKVFKNESKKIAEKTDLVRVTNQPETQFNSTEE